MSARSAVALPLVALALMAGCGSAATTPTTAAGTPTVVATAPAATIAPTVAPTSAPAAAVVVQTGQATVGGTATTVLTDATGRTLYYRTADTSTSIGCMDSCATNWPPVLLPTGTPTGSAAVTGHLTTLAGPNGTQVLYNGHPLYRWVQDSAPGQATGQGIGGFMVATPGLAAA